MKKVLVALSSGLLITGAAQAAMTDVDTDGDGVASYTELLAVYPSLTEEGFNAIDVNADGVVDDTEMTTAVDNGLIPEA